LSMNVVLVENDHRFGFAVLFCRIWDRLRIEAHSRILETSKAAIWTPDMLNGLHGIAFELDSDPLQGGSVCFNWIFIGRLDVFGFVGYFPSKLFGFLFHFNNRCLHTSNFLFLMNIEKNVMQNALN